MNFRCLNSLTLWSLLFGGIIAIIPNLPAWLKISAISVVIASSLLGNIMTVLDSKTVMTYCKVSNRTINIANIIGHILIPILILWLLFREIFSNNKISLIKSIIISLSIIILYIILVGMKITTNYGLPFKKLVFYGLSWISIVIIVVSGMI